MPTSSGVPCTWLSSLWSMAAASPLAKVVPPYGVLICQAKPAPRLALPALLLSPNLVCDVFVHGQCLQTQFLGKRKVFGPLKAHRVPTL